MATDAKRPEYIFYEADALIEQDEVVAASKLLYGLTEQFPEYGRAYNHLGFIYEMKYRDFEKAEAYYRKCLALSPEYTAVYLNYAALLSNQRRTDELEELLNRALKCPGINIARIHKEFGILHELRAEYDASTEAYKRAIAFSFVQTEIDALMLSVDRVRQKKHFLN